LQNRGMSTSLTPPQGHVNVAHPTPKPPLLKGRAGGERAVLKKDVDIPLALPHIRDYSQP
jgi:hypothetical protein